MAHEFGSFTELKAALLALGPEDNLPAVLLTPELAQDILDHDPVNREIRKHKIEQLKREVTGGYWDLRKCTAMRFLPSGQMADGQHRCLAVVATKVAILVPMCIVPDTIGVDEGANRTLVDHLQLSFSLQKEQAVLASIVTKALCEIHSANNRDFLEFFRQHRAFIMESVTKPLGWLEDQMPAVAAIFKPALLAVNRARLIQKDKEPAESVDQLLHDTLNAGVTAPEGSPRRALAKQLYDQMQAAYEKKGAKSKDFRTWTLNALYCERQNVIKNIITARPLGQKKRGKKAKPNGGKAA
jgi:hypothetical protein